MKSKQSTVWKFQDFRITEIFREINFEDSRSAKSAILTHLESLNFYFCEFLHFLKAEIQPNPNFRAPEMAKMAFLELLDSPKLISRKI